MINQTKWKEEEIDMIFKGNTDEYIMKQTGRSILAIQSKRYELTGHYSSEYESPYKNMPRDISCGYCRTPEAKEARVLILAKRLGVRIKGVGRG